MITQTRPVFNPWKRVPSPRGDGSFRGMPPRTPRDFRPRESHQSAPGAHPGRAGSPRTPDCPVDPVRCSHGRMPRHWTMFRSPCHPGTPSVPRTAGVQGQRPLAGFWALLGGPKVPPRRVLRQRRGRRRPHPFSRVKGVIAHPPCRQNCIILIENYKE